MGLFTSRDDEGFQIGDFVRIKPHDSYGFIVDIVDDKYRVKWTDKNGEEAENDFELDDIE